MRAIWRPAAKTGFAAAARHTLAATRTPAQAAHADDEHHGHERPAAADAEDAVLEPDPQRLAARRAPLPARIDERERRAAALQTAVLERAELEDAGAGQHGRADHPATAGEPANLR